MTGHSRNAFRPCMRAGQKIAGVKLLLLLVFSQQGLAPRVAEPGKARLSTLRFVHAVWRHGDRTPVVLMPSDSANNITTWPSGLGEVTKAGLAQEFRLGQFIRQRYDGFLAREYSPFEIFLRSSDVNRTLTSAQANMAGLYPPTEKERFIPSLNWRPIPVHTVPLHEDNLLYDEIACPRAADEEACIFGGEEVKMIEADERALLEFLGRNSGLSTTTPLPFRDVWRVYDPLNSEFHHPEAHQLPSWVNETIREEIWRLYALSSSFLLHTNLVVRLRAGPLFGDILARMQSVAEGRQDQREKFYAYSAHDSSVAAVLAAMGARPINYPQYATLVLVELHRSNDGEYYVQLLHKNQTDSSTLWELDIAGCTAPCTLRQLALLTENIIPVDWKAECGLVAWYHIDSNTACVGIVGILAFLCIVLVIELTLRVLRGRARASNSSYLKEDRGNDEMLLLENIVA